MKLFFQLRCTFQQELKQGIIASHGEELFPLLQQTEGGCLYLAEIQAGLANREINTERRNLLAQNQQMFDFKQFTVDGCLIRGNQLGGR